MVVGEIKKKQAKKQPLDALYNSFAIPTSTAGFGI